MTDLINVVVARHYVECGAVAVLELRKEDGQCLPQFEAGAHIDVHLPNGMIRQYSLCQNPASTDVYRIGILNDPESRGGSVCAFEQIKTGTPLQISAPKNLFPLADAVHSVLIGGGIGITPLISMAYQLHEKGASFELHYCGSSEESSAFIEEIKESPLASYSHFHFKAQGGNHRDNLKQRFSSLVKESHIYTCGPNGFMDWVRDLSLQYQIPKEQFHQEYFQVEVETSGASFELIAKRSNKRINVGAEETILQALAREGIYIEMSCEQGVCGTCMCDVIEGEPDHRDVYFTDEEKASNEQILVCCSRAKTPRLVLDI